MLKPSTPHVPALDELERMVSAAEDDVDWYADALPDEVKTSGVWTQEGDGVCKTWGNAAHGATAHGRALLIAAARNALPDLLKIARAMAKRSPFALSKDLRWLSCEHCGRRWDGAQADFPHLDDCTWLLAHRLAVRSRTP